ncbi:MAG TPA: limonene-1,2-epoxide hydrolase family protein [Polyangiales bacterium]|nr:limonene-1,2-epoxide hydrolase family protein [Polyangiales bacterium]
MQEPQIHTSPTQSPIQVVEAFFDAGCAKDIARASALISDDIVYQNVPFPPDRGRLAVERRLRQFYSMPGVFDVRMHHIAERGGVVLTERTDGLRAKWMDVEFWVCGTFEVRDGKIVLWRDYFDLGNVALKILLGPVRALLRAV